MWSYVLCVGAPGQTPSQTPGTAAPKTVQPAICKLDPQPCGPPSEAWPPPLPSLRTPSGPCSRHHDDAEVQPVPGVPEECEVFDAEAAGQDLDEGLEGVDPREGVPGGERAGQGQPCHAGAGVWVAVMDLLGRRAQK